VKREENSSSVYFLSSVTYFLLFSCSQGCLPITWYVNILQSETYASISLLLNINYHSCGKYSVYHIHLVMKKGKRANLTWKYIWGQFWEQLKRLYLYETNLNTLNIFSPKEIKTWISIDMYTKCSWSLNHPGNGTTQHFIVIHVICFLNSFSSLFMNSSEKKTVYSLQNNVQQKTTSAK